MQDSLQTADIDQSNVPAPFELTAEELQQVGGGVTVPAPGPHDNW